MSNFVDTLSGVTTDDGLINYNIIENKGSFTFSFTLLETGHLPVHSIREISKNAMFVDKHDLLTELWASPDLTYQKHYPSDQ